ncbi:MAG: heparin lyase I family protein [Cyclobacteriaceae bacterium]
MGIKQFVLYSTLAFTLVFTAPAQTILNADGSGQTYELINSAFAPSGNVVEVPDCAHESYGRHISEVYDEELEMYVFRFDIHRDQDNDRCIKFDRQRNEIKAYDKSSDNLLGVIGEKVIYSWKFKLASDFQPSSSFTHLFQIKAVGGSEDAMPSITLTARKGNPDRLELRYAEDFTQVTLKNGPLENLKGQWLQVTSEVLYGDTDQGMYAVSITSVSDGNVLFEYENDAIRMWKTEASFMRPKWGIYRSLNDASSLKDESVLFADFVILEEIVEKEEEVVLASVLQDYHIFPSLVADQIHLSDQLLANYDRISIFNQAGKNISTQEITKSIDVATLKSGLYLIKVISTEGQNEIFRFVKL